VKIPLILSSGTAQGAKIGKIYKTIINK